MNVGEMQRKLSLWATQDKELRFFDLYHLLYHRDWLHTAHAHVKRHAGSRTAGCDGMNMQVFEEHFVRNVECLRHDLKAEQFEPSPVRRAYVPKANGRQRPLGIPTIRDRIVQEALRMILEPIFEADFSRHSYGFRPNRCTKDAVGYLGLRLTGSGQSYQWVIEGDIHAYFDTINHRILMRLVQRRIKDRKLLDLLWRFLRAGVLEQQQYRETLLGTPQGGIVSPLLSNIYLHELDRYMERYVELPEGQKRRRRAKGQANFLYVRYADDWVVLSNGSKAHTEAMRQEIRDFLHAELQLELSMDKTKITHITEGVKFLGFWIERSVGQSGKRAPKIRIPEAAYKKIQQKVCIILAPSTHHHSMTTKIQALNSLIRGWCGYYQHTSSPSFYFSKLGHNVFWQMAHWCGRKYQVSIPTVMRRFRKGITFATRTTRLIRPEEFKAKRYKVETKPNPYVRDPTTLQREELFSVEEAWTGREGRAGATDRRTQTIMEQGLYCASCGLHLQWSTAEVDHKKPRSWHKRPEDAECQANRQVLCKPCHKAKTQHDFQVQSRMR